MYKHFVLVPFYFHNDVVYVLYIRIKGREDKKMLQHRKYLTFYVTTDIAFKTCVSYPWFCKLLVVRLLHSVVLLILEFLCAQA